MIKTTKQESELLDIIARLEEENNRLSSENNKLKEDNQKYTLDSKWNCLTSVALSLQWEELTKDATGVIYCDIDKMHDLNSLYGHNGTDERIKESINNVRCLDIVASRYLNGDEVIFILTSGNCKGFANRMKEEFNSKGINATFAYTTIILDTCIDTITPLDERVQKSKNEGIRGIILD